MPSTPMRVAIATLLLAGLAFAQQTLASGVQRVIGHTADAMWFEKDGSVWVTDGTAAGTHDTGVAAGQYGRYRTRLFVYRPNAVFTITESGFTSGAPVPVAYDFFDADAPEPRIGRNVQLWDPQSRLAEVIDVWDLDPVAGWVSSRRSSVNLQGQPIVPDVIDVERTSTSRTVLLTKDGGVHVGDLFVSDTDRTSLNFDPGPVGSWSQGIFTEGDYVYAYPRQHRFALFGFDGAIWFGIVPFGYSLHEDVAGYPHLRNDTSDEFGLVPEWTPSTPPTTMTTHAPPASGIRALLWSQDRSTFVALSRPASSPPLQVLWDGDTTWTDLAASASTASVRPMGESQGAFYVASDATTGQSTLWRLDLATHVASRVVDHVDALPSEFAPIGGRIAFVADDGRTGREVWLHDPTPGTTRRITDLAPGAATAHPRELTAIGDRLVVLADLAAGPTVLAFGASDLDWIRSPSDGRVYSLTLPMTFEDARREAARLGGELATIRDSGDREFVTATFPETTAWIGFADLDGDGTFAWTSGAPATFTNWCAGEPAGSGARAALMTAASDPCAGSWRAAPPGELHPACIVRDSRPGPIEAFGAPCRGSLPALRWTGGYPSPGASIALEIEDIPGRGSHQAARYVQEFALWIGADSDAFGGWPLPIDLTPFGLPGCWLQIAVLDSSPLPSSHTGLTSTFLSIPPSLDLVGQTFLLQALVMNHATQLQLVTTNALRVQIRD